MKELNARYDSLKEKYSTYLVDFALNLHRKHLEVKFLLIGSGLDDDYYGRDQISNEIKKFNTINANNESNTIKISRDILYLLEFLNSKGYKVPKSYSFEKKLINNNNLEYPFILKKKRSAGGTNVYKIENEKNLISQIEALEKKSFEPTDWLIQEYIEGTPISCTVISNGKECEVITINRQIIGEKFLNSPKDFMYCGNIAPAGLSLEENRIISEISINLTKKLGLKGINGFDFVLKDHFPYFMECNPRIPGSISVSETVLNLNLLDLHIKSFKPGEWKHIKKLIESAISNKFATKLVFFAPKEINKSLLPEINSLEFIHDKSEPYKDILKGEPLCTILYSANSLLDSYNGAKKIVKKIYKIIGESIIR